MLGVLVNGNKAAHTDVDLLFTILLSQAQQFDGLISAKETVHSIPDAYPNMNHLPPLIQRTLEGRIVSPLRYQSENSLFSYRIRNLSNSSLLTLKPRSLSSP